MNDVCVAPVLFCLVVRESSCTTCLTLSDTDEVVVGLSFGGDVSWEMDLFEGATCLSDTDAAAVAAGATHHRNRASSQSFDGIILWSRANTYPQSGNDESSMF
uniref:Putative secreted protein n=1 Tax=Ixodes ricinus TaxID=34613 RepID=A0A6B0UCN5_IXORI